MERANDVEDSVAAIAVEKSAVNDVSTGYEASVTGDLDSQLSASDISVYSNEPNAMAEIGVEMPIHFTVGNAVAMDSIECLNRLADFVPIPVDWSDYTKPELVVKGMMGMEAADMTEYAEAASVAEVTMALSDVSLYSERPSMLEVEMEEKDVDTLLEEITAISAMEDDTFSDYSEGPSQCEVTMATY